MDGKTIRPSAIGTSGRCDLRIGPRVRVTLILESQEPIANRKISRSHDVYCLLADEVKTYDRERFLSLFLDAQNDLLGIEEVSTGHLCASIVHAREVFKAAILINAASIIVVHNHPSGDPSPSADDRRITTNLRESAGIIGIPLLDHVVIGAGQFYSFADHGW